MSRSLQSGTAVFVGVLVIVAVAVAGNCRMKVFETISE
jgi:hypothetical protein